MALPTDFLAVYQNRINSFVAIAQAEDGPEPLPPNTREAEQSLFGGLAVGEVAGITEIGGQVAYFDPPLPSPDNPFNIIPLAVGAVAGQISGVRRMPPFQQGVGRKAPSSRALGGAGLGFFLGPINPRTIALSVVSPPPTLGARSLVGQAFRTTAAPPGVASANSGPALALQIAQGIVRANGAAASSGAGQEAEAIGAQNPGGKPVLPPIQVNAGLPAVTTSNLPYQVYSNAQLELLAQQGSALALSELANRVSLPSEAPLEEPTIITVSSPGPNGSSQAGAVVGGTIEGPPMRARPRNKLGQFARADRPQIPVSQPPPGQSPTSSSGSDWSG